MNIPLVKVGMPPQEELIPELAEVLYSGMIAEGEKVYQFEDEFKRVFGLESGISMSSGTAALHVALVLSGVQHGDEVITTSMTAEPTNTTILQMGASPVFADVEEYNGNICPDSIEGKITTKTKAIVVVHYAGYPVKIKKIKEIAEAHNLKLIEDCAHALGAKYCEKPIGSYGDFSIFSFQAIKHMTTIDGGFLVIEDELVRKAKKIRWFGLEKGVPREEVDITELGYKYNMQNISATVGLNQLAYITSRINKHIYNGEYFNKHLRNIPGLKSAVFENDSKPSYWLYTLIADDSEDVISLLNENGIMASKLHRPNHWHTIFSSFAGDLPNLDKFYSSLVHIPCGWWVDSAEREKIVQVLKRG